MELLAQTMMYHDAPEGVVNLAATPDGEM